jgi:hypothetical protein
MLELTNISICLEFFVLSMELVGIGVLQNAWIVFKLQNLDTEWILSNFPWKVDKEVNITL